MLQVQAGGPTLFKIDFVSTWVILEQVKSCFIGFRVNSQKSLFFAFLLGLTHCIVVSLFLKKHHVPSPKVTYCHYIIISQGTPFLFVMCKFCIADVPQ